jgi:hypothetical protein
MSKILLCARRKVIMMVWGQALELYGGLLMLASLNRDKIYDKIYDKVG